MVDKRKEESNQQSDDLKPLSFRSPGTSAHLSCPLTASKRPRSFQPGSVLRQRRETQLLPSTIPATMWPLGSLTHQWRAMLLSCPVYCLPGTAGGTWVPTPAWQGLYLRAALMPLQFSLYSHVLLPTGVNSEFYSQKQCVHLCLGWGWVSWQPP